MGTTAESSRSREDFFSEIRVLILKLNWVKLFGSAGLVRALCEIQKLEASVVSSAEPEANFGSSWLPVYLRLTPGLLDRVIRTTGSCVSLHPVHSLIRAKSEGLILLPGGRA